MGATGFHPNGEQFASMSREALDVAVRASHEAGLKIAAHCHGFEGTRLAVEAGIDSIEHGTYVDQPTVELMAERGTYMVPTMSTWDARERLATQVGWSRDQMSEFSTVGKTPSPASGARYKPECASPPAPMPADPPPATVLWPGRWS